MTSTFDRWEKDPFFSAAEEVQESADRMESTYRTWIHAKKDTGSVWNLDELLRDLRTTLGTTKWQLEEFERAAKSSYTISTSADDAKDRHRDFVIAIKNQITNIESSLNECTVSHGKPPLPWVQLDKGERDELALFLSGKGHGNSQEANRQTMNECSRSSSHLVELSQVESKEDKLTGHRRTASASADILSWKIMVDDDVSPHDSSSEKTDPAPRKIPSFSGLLNTMESSMSQLKWSRIGYKKLKLTDQPQEGDATLPKTQNLTNGVNICYEKSKSCLDGCDDSYDKQLYGWYGTIQRKLQRSQYHMQYSRPVQVVFSVILLLCLLVVFRAY
ncbi:hypothetical protein CASFOL_000970 [Castilleja foliolosa]|uniref:Syntaxin 6/10/61 N-terminal domain-containing protein n=1 Tax=Castilleja foliolosa TaxID=1961234 RepID=A0ABD3ELT9_9LAMI